MLLIFFLFLRHNRESLFEILSALIRRDSLSVDYICFAITKYSGHAAIYKPTQVYNAATTVDTRLDLYAVASLSSVISYRNSTTSLVDHNHDKIYTFLINFVVFLDGIRIRLR